VNTYIARSSLSYGKA